MRLVFREAYEAGDYSDRATPVPIPNTAVKSVWADGTSTQFGAGRVGRCRDLVYKGKDYFESFPFFIQIYIVSRFNNLIRQLMR